MPNKLIKDGAVIIDDWQLISADTSDVAQLPSGPIIIPLSLWLVQRQQLAGRGQLGILLDSDQSPKLITDQLHEFSLIAIDFPAFADGRGFSYGRELREKHQFSGELRAVGQFMRDQLSYLKRCGFNAYALENAELEPALASLQDFSNSYQASIDQPVPLFRRR
ncbi:MAG: hypothetical protein ACJAYG_002586 [Oceanicoccus sp.]|jgi:uncharacterized protein (DUF934 family)